VTASGVTIGKTDDQGEGMFHDHDGALLVARVRLTNQQSMNNWANGWKIEIVGTDISTEILRKAESGAYTQFEVQRGLPVQLLVKYFKQDGDKWMIDPSLKAMVKYKEFNLLDKLTPLGKFDVVFCRNVLIYFDQETKSRIMGGISELIPDDGLLFLGGAETVVGITDKFKPVPGQRGVYCLTRALAKQAPAAKPVLTPAVNVNRV